MDERAHEQNRPGFDRRGFLAGAGATLAAATLAACGSDAPDAGTPSMDVVFDSRSPHQPGITTRPQRVLRLAAFDLQRDEIADLRDLLAAWSTTAVTLMTGVRDARQLTGADAATGLDPARLSVTFGIGPSLFASGRRDRLGLAAQRPSQLKPLPPFPGDALERHYTGGDLCIQACSDDPQTAFHAIHTLAHEAIGIATPRWTMDGFLPHGAGTPRNLMGFKDGTNNIAGDDTDALTRHVWVGPGDGPSWMHGGTYMIVRRIRTLLDVWDATSVEEQEATIGRHKATGAPLGTGREHDTPDLDATRDGAPVIASDAHIRLAAPATNHGARILRRSYNYADAIDHATGQPDLGLVFVSFQRDPSQFTRIQQRLARHDALRKHLLHTGSAIFACPPAIRRGEHIAQQLVSAAG